MKPVYNIILDGFALGTKGDYNAVLNANAPYLHSLFNTYSTAFLTTYGTQVGLPCNQTGGSEVGHMTMGAGRQVKSLLLQIDEAIENGTFKDNIHLQKLFIKAQKKGVIHFCGLISDGGIHSIYKHLEALCDMSRYYDGVKVVLHSFLDGRDVSERTALDTINSIHKSYPDVIFASVSGRYYSMDRDNNWDRTAAAYKAMTDKSSTHTTAEESYNTLLDYINHYYNITNTSDYYVPPYTIMEDYTLQDDDEIVFFNFRTDRMRQITAALTDSSFTHFTRNTVLKKENIVIFGNYLDAQMAFIPEERPLKYTLGELISTHNIKQLRIAETEKYNHVSFFYNGERDIPFDLEDRMLINTDKTIANFKDKPEMSAYESTEKAISMLHNNYGFILHNYANADVVGHSGDYEATKKAIEVLSHCLEMLVPKALEAGYTVLITADHGNAECMKQSDNSANPSHTQTKVPCIIISSTHMYTLYNDGSLTNIARTITDIMGIEGYDIWDTSLIKEVIEI